MLPRLEIPAGASLVLQCSEELASSLLTLNPRLKEISSIDDAITEPGSSVPESFKSETQSYIALPDPSRSQPVLSFGIGDDDDVRLPEDAKVRQKHFGVILNEHFFWYIGIRYTTTLNSEKLRRTLVPLHPESPSLIKLGGSFFSLLVYGNKSSSSWPQVEAETFWNRFLDADSQTAPSSSTSRGSTSIKEYQDPKSLYITLKANLMSTWSRSNSRKIVYPGMGKYAVLKVYTPPQTRAERTQTRMLSNILKAEHYMIPVTTTFLQEGAFRIFTEYFEGCPLIDIMKSATLPLTAAELLAVFAQIGGGALKWLEEKKIIHRNISPHVILIRIASDSPITSRLTGFSECYHGSSAVRQVENAIAEQYLVAGIHYRAPEMSIGRRYDNKIDIFSLSKITSRNLSSLRAMRDTTPDATSNTSQPPIAASFLEDSFMHFLVEPGVAEQPEDRPTPTDIQAAFSRTLGTLNTEWPPFQYFTIGKTFSIHCYQKNGVEKILREDLQRVLKVLYLYKDISEDTHSDWCHGKDELISLRSAAKHCRHENLTDLYSTLMYYLHNSQSDEESFRIDHVVSIPVYYHAPSRIINPEPIMLLAGAGDALLSSIAPSARWWSVYGPPEWTGNYLDHSSFEILSQEMRSKYGLAMPEVVPRQDSDPVTSNVIVNIDNDALCVVVADQIHPHMALVRKVDKFIHLGQLLGKANAWIEPWDDEDFVDGETARSHCNKWSVVLLDNLCAGCIGPDQIKDYSDEEATSVNTTSSFRKEEGRQEDTSDMQFRFRRHPKTVSGPTCPKPHVESWVDGLNVGSPPVGDKGKSELSDDEGLSSLPPSSIRPTIFTTGPSSSDERHPAKRVRR